MELVARLLGPLEVQVGDRVLGPRDFGGRKPKQILEILLCAGRRAVTKQQLADQLWGDAGPSRANAALETHVSTLRKKLGLGRRDGIVITEPGAYRLDRDCVSTDVERFDELVARDTRVAVDEALALVRGAAMADEPLATWATALRRRCRERHVAALCRASVLAYEADDYAVAAARARAAVEHDPVCEAGYRAAIRALNALGRDTEALRVFRSCVAKLRDELGVEPRDDTRALADAIAKRRREPGPHPPRAPAEPRSFAPAGDVPFLGRRAHLDHLARAAASALAGEPALHATAHLSSRSKQLH